MNAAQGRLTSLDAFRGFVIVAMIWVNYVAGMAGIPYWLEHAAATDDGITVPDLVFPGFLFIVGVAIPLALHRQRGTVSAALLGKLVWRAASLMLAGVVLANAYRYDEAAAVLPRATYMLLFYGAMILLWRDGSGRKSLYAGAALILVVLALFRGRLNAEFDSVWLQHTWWGILGMIGWAYLCCSLVYLATRGERTALMGAFAFMIVVYMGGQAGSLDFLPGWVNGVVSVPQVFGSTAASVMAGALVGTLFVDNGGEPPGHARRVNFMLVFALGLVAAGFMLRPYHPISKIHASESFTLVCAGIVLALFLVFYVLIEVLGWRRWSLVLLPAGANALFAYIVPDLFEQLAAALRVPRFWWPFLASGGGAGLLNALAVTSAMLALVVLATRAGLRLKF